MSKVIRLLCIIALLSCTSSIYAQQGLQIASVFQKYGKQKGVTMVELSNEIVESYEMTLYKSITFKNASDELPFILRCLEADKNKAKKVKEVISGGEIQSGYYQLPQLKDEINRFIDREFNKHGIEISFRQLDVHVKNLEGGKYHLIPGKPQPSDKDSGTAAPEA